MMRTNSQKQMDSNRNFILNELRPFNYQRLALGDFVFLISKRGGILIRKSLIFEQVYKEGSDLDVTTYLSFKGTIHYNACPCEVEAYVGTPNKQVGKHVKLDVRYKGEVIGDYCAVYTGAGCESTGNWPILFSDSAVLTFQLDTDNRKDAESYFRVEYFLYLKKDN